MAATKPDKIREETYDMVVKGMRKIGVEPIGRHAEGIVFKNHLDGEHIVIKVIRKKKPLPKHEIVPHITYEEKIIEYNNKKEERK